MGPTRKHPQRRWLGALALLVLMAAAAPAPAEDLPWGGEYQADPIWMPFLPELDYVKTDVEAQRSSYHPAGGATISWNQLTLLTAVGIKWRSYVYSPFLLNYSLVFEPGYNWQRTGYSGSSSRTQELMLNGSAMVNLLSLKPYATSITFGRSNQEVQSDFFRSQRVDQQNWSALSGYRTGPVPVTLTLEKTHEDRSGDNADFITDQLKLGLHATNDRKNGNMTIADYQFNRYDNRSSTDTSRYSSESSSNHLLVMDTEHFQKSTLYSSLSYNERLSSGLSSSDLNATTSYNRELTPHLRSFSTYSFSDSSGNGFRAMQNNLLAGLDHQLYESLASRLELHGVHANNESLGTTLSSSTVGVTGSATYNKRLGRWAHLSLNETASYDLTNQKSTGGELTIPDEAYTIPANGPMIIRLKSPSVLSVTGITKNNVPLDATEWTAITTADPWQIQFIGGGAHSLKNGDAVSITYVVKPNPSGQYSARTNSSEIALRFWQDRVGIRASYLSTENSASTQGFILDNLRQYQLGADVGWQGFHADANYTDQRSTLYSYRSYALNESYSFQVSLNATAGINCYQQWNEFPVSVGSASNQAQTLVFYNYMLHYNWRPPGGFSLNAESGLQQQRGTLKDQNLFAARVYLNWTLGKLEFHLGYENEYNKYVGELYMRHFAFLRMRRSL